MKGKILVTDSLFVFDHHVKHLENAEYEVERLDKPEASEPELVDAVKDKVGYILGGIEHVTEPVIAAADNLKAIVFTGIAYKDYIPAWELAEKKGIRIGNVPDGPTHAVAEWAIGSAILMNRRMMELGGPGDKKFATTPGMEGQRVGIIGFGRIGQKIAEMLAPFKPSKITYYNRTQKDAKNAETNSLDGLLQSSDIIFLALSKEAGEIITPDKLAMLSDNALIVNIAHPGLVNIEALYNEVKNGRLRGAFDHTPGGDFSKLPTSHWYDSNESTAFNTATGVEWTSSEAVRKLLELLND